MEDRIIARLVDKAKRYWANGLPIPLCLAADMMAVGIDVEHLERKHSA